MLELETYKAFDFYKSFLHWYCEWYKPSYLEIGCLGGDLCASLNTTRSVGIDPNLHPDWSIYESRREEVKFYQMTSDEFFLGNVSKFGLIFIDGDHHADQVRRDVSNSLRRLQDGGLIVMHDTLPPTINETDESLCGTAYQVAKELRADKQLEVYTFPVTFGVTLVGKVGTGFQW